MCCPGSAVKLTASFRCLAACLSFLAQAYLVKKEDIPNTGTNYQRYEVPQSAQGRPTGALPHRCTLRPSRTHQKVGAIVGPTSITPTRLGYVTIISRRLLQVKSFISVQSPQSSRSSAGTWIKSTRPTWCMSSNSASRSGFLCILIRVLTAVGSGLANVCMNSVT